MAQCAVLANRLAFAEECLPKKGLGGLASSHWPLTPLLA
jgi:hypothetical protein